MIFFTHLADEEENSTPEEVDDTDANLDDSVLDEISDDSSDDDEDVEGFGHIGEGEALGEGKEEDDDETEDEGKGEDDDDDSIDSLEEDAEEMDYDRFDDVDEL